MVLYQTCLFVVTSYFDCLCLPWQPKGKICENILKNQLCGGKSWSVAELFLTLASTKRFFLLFFFFFLLPLRKYFGCYGNLKFTLTYNGKSENWDWLLFHCRYFEKSFTVLHQAYHFSPNLSVWSVATTSERLNLRKYIKKINSEAIRGIKMKLCRIIHNIIRYKKTVFYCHCLSTLVAMATLNFHRLIMGKSTLAFIAISLQIFSKLTKSF